jgi:hypothetical protein
MWALAIWAFSALVFGKSFRPAATLPCLLVLLPSAFEWWPVVEVVKTQVRVAVVVAMRTESLL